MIPQKSSVLGKVFVCVATVLMIAINVAATLGLFGGTTTAQISDMYPTLFTPAGMTFSIWGIIYLALLAFAVMQLFWGKNLPEEQQGLLKKIRFAYILTCCINFAWIIAWQFNAIPVAMALIACLLIFLIRIILLTKKMEVPAIPAFVIRFAFGIYFGWITVATIANAAVLLVSLGWNGKPLSPVIWTIFTLAIGALIGLGALYSTKNWAYGLVLVWAYFGIFMQHISATAFAGKYPAIIITTVVCMVFFLLATVVVVFKRKTRQAP